MKWGAMLLTVAVFLTAGGTNAFAQTRTLGQPEQPGQSSPPAALEQPGGQYMVPAGTRFLVRLGDKLGTKDDKAGKRFVVRTLEPLTAADGTTLATGAEISAHIDKVEPAGKTGRARLWLTFDDIRTAAGWKPLVAELIDAPGVHSVRVAYDHEGEIMAGSSKRQKEEEAMAEGAIAGAAPGVAARNAKEAAIGAGIGAATAFIATSGLGQELTIEKDTKLELVLERGLVLGRK